MDFTVMIVRETEEDAATLKVEAFWSGLPLRKEVEKILRPLIEEFGAEKIAVVKKVPMPDFI